MQVDQMRNILLHIGLLHEQPIIYYSNTDRAECTAKGLVGDSEVSWFEMVGWLYPESNDWFYAGKETNSRDPFAIATAVLREASSKNALRVRDSLIQFRNMVIEKTIKAELPEDCAVVMITHLEFMRALGPLFGFSSLSESDYCSGYVLDIDPATKVVVLQASI